MRSNADILVLAGALTLGGCSSSWWHDPPAPPVVAAPPEGTTAPSDWATSGSNAAPDPTPRTPRPALIEPATPDFARPPPAQSVRYDNVGYAAWSSDAGTVAAAHPTIPPGSFAEVTSLDTGKTILVPITARSRPGREIELSGAAALELGLGTGGDRAGVRVRAANANGGDLAAFQAGRPAPARPDTPPVLLNALRRKLAGTQGRSDAPGPAPMPETRPPVTATPAPAPARRPAARGAAAAAPKAGPGYYVQLAALSDATRARRLAQSAGGSVSSTGSVHRVRLGPFDDLKAAQAARDGAARRGYGEARIVRQD